MKNERELKSNIWKYFLIILTNRRNYIPILSIYFLTLPNTAAQQIGLYTGIGWLAGFIFEIPSGYLSDKFGHKKALILAKFFMLFSTLFFIFGKSIPYFILGSSFIALGFAFTSGTAGAFLHNTLIGLKREKDYAEVGGKSRAKASLISAIMILALPLLTNISLLMPIQIYLVFDVIGIFTVFSLYTPKIKYSAEDEEGEKILSQLKRFRGNGFYTVSIFVGILTGFIFALSTFKEPFVESLGFPIIYIGSIMALSRVIWFIVGHNLKFLKKIKLEKLFLYEIILIPGLLIFISQIQNPYIIGFIIATIMGYLFGRGPIVGQHFLNKFVINKRYKATMISIKQLIKTLIQAIIVLTISFAMAISFNLGFLIAGIFMFVILISMYPSLRKIILKK